MDRWVVLGLASVRTELRSGLLWLTEHQLVDRVNNNPEAFKDAYFDIASIRVFQ